MSSQQFPSGRIYVAGHRGMVGAAVVRELLSRGVAESDLITRGHSELDLIRQSQVESFFESERPDVVIFAAAKVGGIHANDTYPAEFIYDNLMMAANAIHAAHQFGTKRFLFLGSTCIYPRM
ncbi:MAG: NAD-dependent epimerase/dehydratase family protein, partial [Planctomycetales bacterium]|nr:NAD-dependent epimerase/dehydratase family protein [Planctomycetales bacterium]